MNPEGRMHMNLGKETFRTVALLLVALGATAGSALGETRSPAAFGAASCQATPAEAIGRRAPTPTRISTGPAPRVRRASQVTRNEQADVTFDLRPSSSGGVEVSARSGTLVVKKTVQSTGDFVLEFSNDRDKVTIAFSGQGTTVSRANTSVEQRRSGSAPDTADRIRRLLADSPAVIQFRALGAGLLEAEDRSPASLAFIVADAMVGMLTGDVGAPRRVAKFLARGGEVRQRPVAMAIDCFTLMEQRMVEAWSDYMSCWMSVWPNDFFQQMCAARWFIQVESYWFGFISCSGFNW
jgi:hypothetical protein